MKIGQYCQRQRCRHVELEQFWQAFASRGFVSDSWTFLFIFILKVDVAHVAVNACTAQYHGQIEVCGFVHRLGCGTYDYVSWIWHTAPVIDSFDVCLCFCVQFCTDSGLLLVDTVPR